MRWTVIDLETTGLNPRKDKITLAGFLSFDSFEDEGLYTILESPSKRDMLRTLQEIGATKYVFQHGKFDTGFILEQYGIDLPIDEDTLILGALLASVPEIKKNKGNWLGLKPAAMRELGVPAWDIPLDEKSSLSVEAKTYLTYDLKYTRGLFQKYRPQLLPSELFTYRLILKASEAFARIELNGIHIDTPNLEKTRSSFREDYQVLHTKMLKTYGDYNFNSTKQMSELLYKKLELPCVVTTDKGAPSTGSEALANLRGMHPIIEDILQLRLITKALGFLEEWSTKNENSRLYPTYNLHVAATGRTSCSNPNIQQVPRNKKLKSMFCAPEGYRFVQCDYSQMELRIASIVAGVSAMKEAYRNGEDLHIRTAEDILGVEVVTKQERNDAKPVNFGFLYGMQAAAFPSYAKINYGKIVSAEDAYALRAKYFAKYYELSTFYEKTKLSLLTNGYLVGLFGRRYKVGHIALSYFKSRSDYERSGINSQVQGPASDIALMAIAEIHTTFKNNPEVKMVGAVHDSILFEVQDNENFKENVKKIKKIMEKPHALQWAIEHYGYTQFDIPLVADVEVGRWSLGKEVDLD